MAEASLSQRGCILITIMDKTKSVISGFPHKTVHPFRDFLAVLPPHTLYKVETRKKNSGYTLPTLFVGRGEGLGLCELENAPEMQKCPKTFAHDCSLVGLK